MRMMLRQERHLPALSMMHSQAYKVCLPLLASLIRTFLFTTVIKVLKKLVRNLMLHRKIYENLSAQLFLVIDIDASSLIPCTCINNSSYHTVFQAKNKSIMVKRSKEPSPDQMRTEDRSSLQASNYLLIGGWIFDGQSPHERMICMFSSRLQSYHTYNSAHDTYDSYGNDN